MNPEVAIAIDHLKELTRIWEEMPCLVCEHNQRCEIGKPLIEFARTLIANFMMAREDIQKKNKVSNLQRMMTANIFSAFNAWAELYVTQFDDFENLFRILILGVFNIVKKKLPPEKLENLLAFVLKQYDGQVNWAKVLEKVKEKKQ